MASKSSDGDSSDEHNKSFEVFPSTKKKSPAPAEIPSLMPLDPPELETKVDPDESWAPSSPGHSSEEESESKSKAESEEEKETDEDYAASSGEEEETKKEEEEEDEEDDKDDSESDESEPQRKKRKPLSRNELREVLEAAGEVRRSSRARHTVQRLDVGSHEDSDEEAPKRPKGGRRRAAFESESSGSGGGEKSEASESEYEDESRRPRRPKRNKEKRRKGRRISSNSDDDGFDSDAARFSTRRAANKSVKYKEAESDEDIDDDDVLEWDEETPGPSGTPEPPAETIEKVIKHRRGKKGAIGSDTTMYHISEKGDPNADFSGAKEDGERHYLIKWLGWAHIHNTWETRESLEAAGVKGLKKLDNYAARTKEVERWKRSADADSIEYFECEEEMSQQLYDNYQKCERIVAHQKGKGEAEDSVEYYVKWSGLPYSECTWEDGVLCAKWYQGAIDAYQQRRESRTIPKFASGRNSERFRLSRKFAVMKEQPTYLGGTPESGLVLRDYQLAGLNWLLAAYSKGNSCILADEMGLGKTIQTAGFLSTLANDYGVFGPFLVIVPLSTMAAWEKEMARWAPQLNTITYIGDVASRETIRTFEWHTSGTRQVKFNACLTTYEIVLKDKVFLSQLEWAVIAVDEAHRLKNHESQLYTSLVDFSSAHRLLITGTPLQNSLKELWALLHFIMPNLFESWEDFDYRHGRGETKGYNSIHRELEPFLLRRVKKDVEKSLPAKVEQILRVDMTKVQKQYYKWILTKNFKELSRGVSKGSQSTLLNIMMELKKCCNHAFLIKPPEEDADYSEEKLIRASGKLLLLHKLLKQLKEKGHRVLIFSQMVMMLDLLQEYLRFEKLNFQRLDGTMRGELRKQAMDHFNEPGSTDFAFLLSTKAGGLGVNLATADTVIIVDSDWNPQNDLQAQSRAHRIGQKRQVNIYRLVTKNSVEEDIVERAKQKLVLDHLVIQRMDTTGRTVLAKSAATAVTANPFNREELATILKFGAAELFKEKEGEEAEPEVDIDDILNRAETREADEDTNKQADELLSAFKVANFAIDEAERLETREGRTEDWAAIIPEADRRRMEEEEQLALQKQLNLAPRQRNQLNKLPQAEDSDDDWKKDKRKKGAGRRRKGSDSDSDSDDDDDHKGGRKARTVLFGFTEKELKSFLKSFRKFASPGRRLAALGNDAGLEEHSDAEIRQLVEALQRSLKDAADEDEPAKGPGKKEKGPLIRFGGLEVAARPLLRAQAELEPLYAALPEAAAERRHWRLPVIPKAQRTWGAEWAERDDAALLRGIYDYGYGSWESIKMDPDLGLTDKLLPADKKKKPQTNHVVSRADYLLKLIAAAAPAAPTAASVSASTSSSATGRRRAAAAETENGAPEDEKPPKRQRKAEKEKKEPKAERRTEPTADPDDIVAAVNVNIKFAKDMENRKSKSFLECVQIMKPMRKAMQKALNPDPDSPEDFNDNLVKVGEHISGHLATVVLKSKPKQMEKWASYLWLFVGNFFEHLDAVRLLKLYRIQKKKKALAPPEIVSRKEPQLKSALKRSQPTADHAHHHKHHKHHRHKDDRNGDAKPSASSSSSRRNGSSAR